jgi:hypothetical protein
MGGKGEASVHICSVELWCVYVSEGKGLYLCGLEDYTLMTWFALLFSIIHDLAFFAQRAHRLCRPATTEPSDVLRRLSTTFIPSLTQNSSRRNRRPEAIAPLVGRTLTRALDMRQRICDMQRRGAGRAAATDRGEPICDMVSRERHDCGRHQQVFDMRGSFFEFGLKMRAVITLIPGVRCRSVLLFLGWP